jgi:pfkB family carbohydrate kinase
MRIGILGQPCIDEIIHPSTNDIHQALGGILYSFAAMERLMREAKRGSFVPMSWFSVPDRPLLDPLIDTFRCMESQSGFWPIKVQTNRVQLVYCENGDRTEHCPHILPSLTATEINSAILESLDGLFVNMISGFDVGIETLETALHGSKKKPFVHIDIHALVLGPLSERDDNAPFGGGREPRGVKEWKRWLALADSVQMNELEARWFADPEIQSEQELLKYILLSNQFPKLRYLILTRAERGATLFDFENEMVYNALPPTIEVIETTGSGDVFGSAFVFFILFGKRSEKALTKAVEWASWNTTLRSINQILDAPFLP